MSNMYQMMCRTGVMETPLTPQLKASGSGRYSVSNLEFDASECNSRGIVKSPTTSCDSRKSLDGHAHKPLHQMTISFKSKKNEAQQKPSPPPSDDDSVPMFAPLKNIQPHMEEESFRSVSSSVSARDRTRIPADAYSLVSDPAIALGLAPSPLKQPARHRSMDSTTGSSDTASNTSSDDSSSSDGGRRPNSVSPRSTVIAPPAGPATKLPATTSRAMHHQSSLELPLTRVVQQDDFSTDDVIFEDLNLENSPEFDSLFYNTNLLLDQDGGMTVASYDPEDATVAHTVVDDEAFSGELWSTMMKTNDANDQDRRCSYSKYRDMLQAPTKRCSTFQRRGSFGDESVGPPPATSSSEARVKTVNGVRFVPVERSSSHRHNRAAAPSQQRASSTRASSSSNNNKNMADMYDKIDQRVQQLLESDTTRLEKLQRQLRDLKKKKDDNSALLLKKPSTRKTTARPPMSLDQVKKQEEQQWSADKNTLYYGHDDENDGFGYY